MAMREFAEYLAVKRLNDSTMKAYLNYYKLFDRGLADQDLTQSYVNQFLLTHTSNVARAFLTNLFEFLEITHLKIPKLTGRRKRKKRRSLTPQEIDVLRKWLYHNKKIKFMICFEITYYCALRRAEVLKIKIRDFDLNRYAEDPTKPCRLLIHGKGNKERYVPVPQKTMERIINYIEKSGKTMDDRLFNIHRTVWHEVFKQAVKSTMDYNFTLHDLRRSRATFWINQGIDISRVQKRLGHESIQTTQVYINLDEKREFDAWASEDQ